MPGGNKGATPVGSGQDILPAHAATEPRNKGSEKTISGAYGVRYLDGNPRDIEKALRCCQQSPGRPSGNDQSC